MFLNGELWNFIFFCRGDVSPAHSELCRFVSLSWEKHQVPSPVIILFKMFLSASAIVIMCWQDVTRFPFARVSRIVEQNVHTTFSYPKSISESEELQSWGGSMILLPFLMRFDGHFRPNQQQPQFLRQFESILEDYLSRHFLPKPLHLEIENNT